MLLSFVDCLFVVGCRLFHDVVVFFCWLLLCVVVIRWCCLLFVVWCSLSLLLVGVNCRCRLSLFVVCC